MPLPTQSPATRRKEFLDGQPTNPRPHPKPTARHRPRSRRRAGGLLEHLQAPAAFGGHEFSDWPLDQITNGFGGDLDARHRHDHTRLTHVFAHTTPTFSATPCAR